MIPGVFKKAARLCAPILAAIALSGCSTSTYVMVGKTHPPTNPEEVKVYYKAPKKYEEIALVKTDSDMSFRLTNQGKVDATIERAKKEAAKLGANGILIHELGQTGSTTTVNGASYTSGNYTTTTATGTTEEGDIKTFQGMAIFVTEE